MTKAECRKKLRSIILELTSEEKQSKSREISKRLQEFLLLKKHSHKIIGGYYPLKSEVNYLIENSELVSAYPLMTSDETLVFKESKLEHLVERKVYGQLFLEPRENAVDTLPEVLIIPGLGFSQNGKRIGKGKGFYDKYLSKNNVVKIGICFHEQLVDQVPTDRNDIGMDFIITDKVLVEI